jgi:hypothetical protein
MARLSSAGQANDPYGLLENSPSSSYSGGSPYALRSILRPGRRRSSSAPTAGPPPLADLAAALVLLAIVGGAVLLFTSSGGSPARLRHRMHGVRCAQAPAPRTCGCSKGVPVSLQMAERNSNVWAAHELLVFCAQVHACCGRGWQRLHARPPGNGEQERKQWVGAAPTPHCCCRRNRSCNKC